MEYWRCKGKQNVKSDGLGCGFTSLTELEEKVDLRESSENCINVNVVTLDASDTKCPESDQICCKKPDLKARRCDPARPRGLDRWGLCGRNDSAEVLTLSALSVERASQPGEFPHMCIIYKRFQGIFIFIGGASLIARNKLITVAHKFLV